MDYIAEAKITFSILIFSYDVDVFHSDLVYFFIILQQKTRIFTDSNN